MKRFSVACVGLLALAGAAGTAVAADLPARAPAPYYPTKAPPYMPVYNWTGFYIGINGGGAWGGSAWDTTGGFNTSGGLVGGTVGYNYQMGQAVLGVEGDIDWASISGTTVTGCALGCKTSDSWLSTVRGRLGYAADRFMPFVTAGGAFGDIKASTPGLGGSSATNAGWTAGGGLEFAIAGGWSAKAEYLYVDLGKFNCGTGCTAVGTVDNVTFHTNLLRAGLNYRF
jgi:outer membrane immunogenic protein